MKIRAILFLLAVFYLAGCVADGALTTAGASQQALLNAGCSQGNLKFHVGESYLVVTPKNKCMDSGYTYIASIVAHGGYTIVEGDVNISGAATWLNKSNTPNKDQIEIVVPVGTAVDEYKYSLEASGAGMLDPHVRVRK
jgi:hypothetical protein